MPYPYIPTYSAPWPYQQPAGQLEQLRAQYQPQQQPAPQQNSGLIWVQGEEGAKAYMVAPGASVLLMDSEAQAFYIKSADASGMPMPLRIFDYTERSSAGRAVGIPQEKAQEYATKQELQVFQEKIAQQIEGLRSAVPERRNGKDDQHGKLIIPAV